MARTKVTANPPPPSINYRASYSLASDRLLAETSSLIAIADWRAHVDSEPLGKSFGRVHDAYISVRPYTAGESVCVDNRSNDGEQLFFFYQTVFKRIGQRILFSNFERELLTELNVAPAQLHPNSWADGRGPNTNPLKGHQNVKLRQPLELWSKRGQEDAFYMSKTLV